MQAWARRNRTMLMSVGEISSGQLIEVCDEAGTRIGESRLGETPWPGTSALYVAEVELAAPATEGIPAWSARLPPRGGGPGAAAESGLPHEEACATFSFRTARPPEHRVTVKVTDKETEAPLENVEVRLGGYRAATDAQGLASLELPGGVYELDAWKVGYETLPRTVEVGKDLMIQVEALLSPETDPDDERVNKPNCPAAPGSIAATTDHRQARLKGDRRCARLGVPRGARQSPPPGRAHCRPHRMPRIPDPPYQSLQGPRLSESCLPW